MAIGKSQTRGGVRPARRRGTKPVGRTTNMQGCDGFTPMSVMLQASSYYHFILQPYQCSVSSISSLILSLAASFRLLF
jgi:hypothetical protein